MVFTKILEPRSLTNDVILTVTITGAHIGGIAVRICDRDDLTGGQDVEGDGDESGRSFVLGQGADVVGKVVLCETVTADVGAGDAGATVTWSFENAKTLFDVEDFEESMPMTLENGIGVAPAQFDF